MDNKSTRHPPGRRSARIVDALDVGESAEVSEERLLAAGLRHVLLEDRVRPRHHALALVSMPVKSANVSEVWIRYAFVE